MALLALSNAGVPAHFSIFWFSFYGVNKHHQHDKVFGWLATARHSKTKSRGWMMRSELRSEVFGGKSRFSDDGPKLRRYNNNI